MAHQAATLDDVAKLSGVSKSTVSRILSAKPGVPIPFSQETQARVRTATERLGYRPSRIARGLLKSRTSIVGLVIPTLQDGYFSSVISIIEERLAEDGYSVLLANTRGSAATEREKIDDLLSWRVDGLIVVPAQETTDAGLFWDLWRQQVPFVLVDRTFPDTPFASVTTDDAAGTHAAIEYLIRRGARRIACAGGSMAISTNRVRASAYRETLIQHGILPSMEYLLEVPSNAAGGREAVGRLLGLAAPPEALFCFSDLVAAGAMAACHERGLRIPDDLALVGYADLEFSDLLQVPLTTVRQPGDALAQRTAEVLLERLSDNETSALHEVMPVELIQRASA